MAGHVFPWWGGFFLASPLRRLRHDPEAIIGPYVKPGMTVADIGCGMGFFSLPLARLAGAGGKVIGIDLQEKMLDGLVRRAKKSGLSNRIVPRRCESESLGTDDLAESIDFALAFNVVHEVPDSGKLLDGLFRMLKKDGRVLVSEPEGHVAEQDFAALLEKAAARGFHRESDPVIRGERCAVLRKPQGKA